MLMNTMVANPWVGDCTEGNPEFMDVSKRLKDLLSGKETLVMPDAYDPISARIIEQAGFKAVQCSGYSFSVAACRKQEIDIGLKENLAITARIAEAVSVPVMADGEDGFGGVDQIADTIERYVKAGTAGVNLEDQVLDGQPGPRVVDATSCRRRSGWPRKQPRRREIPIW